MPIIILNNMAYYYGKMFGTIMYFLNVITLITEVVTLHKSVHEIHRIVNPYCSNLW
jgi:hypothetical protein